MHFGRDATDMDFSGFFSTEAIQAAVEYAQKMGGMDGLDDDDDLAADDEDGT